MGSLLDFLARVIGCMQMFLMEIYNTRGRNTYFWREKTLNLVVDICSLRGLWTIQVRGVVGRCGSHETGQDQRHKVGNHQLIGGSCNSGRTWHYQGWPSHETKRGKDSENSGKPHYWRVKWRKGMRVIWCQTGIKYRRKAQKSMIEASYGEHITKLECKGSGVCFLLHQLR